MDLLHLLMKTATCISKEDITNVINLTFVKEVYSFWESNDGGEDFSLYTGLDVNGVTPRYFLMHFQRDWNGGWTHDESKKWYELSEGEYSQLCNLK